MVERTEPSIIPKVMNEIKWEAKSTGRYKEHGLGIMAFTGCSQSQ